MTKTIVRKNVLSLTLSILIGLATNLCLASNDQEELSDTQHPQWQVTGNFSDIIDRGQGVDLNRTFRCEPQDQRSLIKNIDVCGYRDGNIIISINMKRAHDDLIQELIDQKLLERKPYFKEELRSDDKDKFDLFLNFFVERNLIPSEIRTQILQKIKNEVLTPEEQQKQHLIDSENQRHSQEVDDLELVEFAKVGRFTSQEAKNISIDHVGYTNSKASYPIIGAHNADSGIIVGAYNPNDKSAALCYLSAWTNISSLTIMFDHIRSCKNSSLKLYLAGTPSDDFLKNDMAHLRQFIEDQPNISIEASMMYTLNAMAIDSRTGDVFHLFKTNQLAHGEQLPFRMQIASLRSKLFRLSNQKQVEYLQIEPGLEPNPKLN